MKLNKSISRFALGAVLMGSGALSAFAAEETLRDLAKERGRFIGTILNSEWFNDDIEPEFEEIHKTQFNVVVAENEMKFDATEPKDPKKTNSTSKRATRWSNTHRQTDSAFEDTLSPGTAKLQTG